MAIDEITRPDGSPAGRDLRMPAGAEVGELDVGIRPLSAPCPFLTDARDAASDTVGRVTVSVLVPTLNEARNLPYVLPRIPSWVDEVLLVDGGSTDGTVDVARSLLPSIIVIGQPRAGKGAALRAGFAASHGDIIVTLDADGSTDPAELPAFVGCLLSGADFVKGSRFLQGGGTRDMGVVRRAGNWALRSAVRTAFGGRYSDLCYGYNAFWRHLLPVLDGDADGFEIETMLNVRALAAGMRVVEVPSYESPRIHGLSNLNTWRDGYRVLRTITRERRTLRDERRGAPRRARPFALPPMPAPGVPVSIEVAAVPTVQAEPVAPSLTVQAEPVAPSLTVPAIAPSPESPAAELGTISVARPMGPLDDTADALAG
jgi:Glycosyl transferase family 2